VKVRQTDESCEQPSTTPEDHFGDGRDRRDNFRIPNLSELSGLMDSIFLPAFKGLLDFFNAIWDSPARMALLRVPVYSSLR
jgi:hypothetical protein